MKQQRLRGGLWALGAFGLWTASVRAVDVRPIGPLDTTVGLAAINGFVHELTGVNLWLYTLTDWLGLVPLGIMAGFSLVGLAQWIRRKHLRQVDRSILLLGGFYLAVMAAYVFFETVVINYRPVLLAGNLEASYPSSTTMLVLCVMPTAVMQLRRRVRRPGIRGLIHALAAVFSVLMVIGRLLSGVHWFSDIAGGALLSAGLVQLYRSFAEV